MRKYRDVAKNNNAMYIGMGKTQIVHADDKVLVSKKIVNKIEIVIHNVNKTSVIAPNLNTVINTTKTYE